MKPRLHAQIKDGKIIPDNITVFKSWLKKLEGKEVQIIIEKRKNIRSLKANNYYWLLIELIAQELGYTKEEAHEAFKWMFLKKHNVKIPTVRSTSDLDNEEFTDYIEKVKVFSAQELNMFLPEPEDLMG